MDLDALYVRQRVRKLRARGAHADHLKAGAAEGQTLVPHPPVAGQRLILNQHEDATARSPASCPPGFWRAGGK